MTQTQAQTDFCIVNGSDRTNILKYIAKKKKLLLILAIGPNRTTMNYNTKIPKRPDCGLDQTLQSPSFIGKFGDLFYNCRQTTTSYHGVYSIVPFKPVSYGNGRKSDFLALLYRHSYL